MTFKFDMTFRSKKKIVLIFLKRGQIKDQNTKLE